MKTDYERLLKQYKEILVSLILDEREVSDEMIQIIRDDIEDIQIILGNASQIQPKLEPNIIGYDID